jgi:predicted dehydrogenase
MTIEHKITYCRICESLCGMVAEVQDGRLLALRPDKEHPLSAGFACQKGIAFTEVVNDPDRVTSPLRRRPDGSFEEVGWDEAMNDIAKRLSEIHKRHGSGAVGWYFGNPGAFSHAHPMAVVTFVHGLGLGTHLYSASSQDTHSRFMASQLLYGIPSAVPIPDLSRTDLLVVMGVPAGAILLEEASRNSYDNAVHTIGTARLLGDLHSIRAQWHRGNLPGKDSWQPPLPGDAALAKRLAGWKKDLEAAKPGDIDKLVKQIAQLEAQIADQAVDAAAHGYTSLTLPTGATRTPLEELIRWRLWNRTGGGLMAELGSHQLDAAGIFVSAMHGPGKKIKPLTVTAVGNRSIFPADREIDDHVYCTYEYPAPGYFDEAGKVADPNKKIVVTYSSINGNGFGEYGEVVMGTKGTLVLEREQDVMLYKDSAKDTRVTVAKAKDGTPTLDTTESGGGGYAAGGKGGDAKPPSRGYQEEMEHWAWCIRNPAPENQPRCKPEVAIADAVIALVSNIALANPATQARIEFKPEWFDIASDETPEGVKPDIVRDRYQV